MRIIHLMAQSKAFNEEIADLCTRINDGNTHELAIFVRSIEKAAFEIATDKIDGVSIHNIRNYDSTWSNSSRLLSFLKGFDKIVLHSNFLSGKLLLLLLVLHKRTLHKMIWIAYGYDLYRDFDNKNIDPINRFILYLQKQFGKNIRHFVADFPPDIQVFQQKFGTKARVSTVIYKSKPFEFFQYDYSFSSITDKVRNNMEVVIQIGHSALSELDHRKTIDDLAGLAHENVTFVFPLSYGGNAQYVKDVEAHAISKLGKKAIFIKDFRPINEFYKTLYESDIVIFNIQRQSGLLNIFPLLYMGKKIYIPKKSVMFEYFTRKGLPIQAYEDLHDISFESLTQDIDGQAEKSYVISKFSDAEALLNRWRALYKPDNISENVCDW